MRGLIVLGVLLILIVAACTQESATSQEPETTTAVSAAPTTTTTAVMTTTMASTADPTTTTVPYVWPWAGDAHAYAYQSVGYSCGPDPTTGCKGDADMTLDGVWLHREPDSTTADCLDILMNALDTNVLNRPGKGPADDDIFIGTGWGVRLVQLDAPPAGFDIGGEAWLELTVSNVSATDFAARPSTTSSMPTENHPLKLLAPTDTDPVSISAPPGTTNVVEELVLINTTDDMMQWIIALTDDQIYHHYATYTGLHGAPALTIKINDELNGSPDAFDASSDDLCDWFSAEEIDTIVARAYEDNNASPIPHGYEETSSRTLASGSMYSECSWMLPGMGPGRSLVRLLTAETGPFYDYGPDGPIGERWSPHPALSEGVRVDREVVVSTRNDLSGVAVTLLIEGQDRALEFFHLFPPGFEGDADVALAIADEMLRHMGWVPVASD